MTTSEQVIRKFAQHYIANPQIIRSTRGTNMTAINPQEIDRARAAFFQRFTMTFKEND